MSNAVASDRERLKELTKAKEYLCKYYGYKCFTGSNGKCPMTKYYCYDYPTLSSMFQNISSNKRAEVSAEFLIKSAKAVGYEV